MKPRTLDFISERLFVFPYPQVSFGLPRDQGRTRTAFCVLPVGNSAFWKQLWGWCVHNVIFIRQLKDLNVTSLGFTHKWKSWPPLLTHTDSVHSREQMPRALHGKQFLNFCLHLWGFQLHGGVHIGIKHCKLETAPLQREPTVSEPETL